METVVRIAGGAARVVRGYALAAAAGAAVVAVFLFRDGLPDDGPEWALVVVALALAAWPAAVLLLFSAALAGLAALPARLRATPGDARGRAEELARIGEQVRAARGARLTRLPLLLWRFARVTGSSRELLTPHAAVVPLASVPFLVLSAAAAVAASLVLVTAFVLLVVAAAS